MPLYHPATRTSETQDRVSLLRLISASTNLNEAREISNSSVSNSLPHDHWQAPYRDSVLGTLTSRTSNTIRWSPRGRHVVLATVGSSSKSELEFWDLDFNTEEGKKEGAGDSSGIQALGTADHYGVTDVEWDPSGRYLATSASAWRHTVRDSTQPIVPSSDRSILFKSLRMVTRSGISRAKNSKNTSWIDSNSSSGDHVHARS